MLVGIRDVDMQEGIIRDATYNYFFVPGAVLTSTTSLKDRMVYPIFSDKRCEGK